MSIPRMKFDTGEMQSKNYTVMMLSKILFIGILIGFLLAAEVMK